jgi:4'-phosphopantetheinyl transferase
MDSPLYTLDSDDLHVWHVDLDCSASTVGRLRRFLSLDENIRADQFYFAIDQNRFVIARASLRTVLAGYLPAHPREITFRYGPQGKPSITNSSAAEINLSFNMAHSGSLALVAVGRRTHIGIDVEEIRADLAETKIAEDFFSTNEIEQLRSLPASKQLQAFFTCWTRKEAFLKAKGVGLSQALDQFSVTVDPDDRARLLETTWDPAEGSHWFLDSIDVGPAFAAALAIDSKPRRICRRDLEPDQLL